MFLLNERNIGLWPAPSAVGRSGGGWGQADLRDFQAVKTSAVVPILIVS
jgi:hypothetical protein